MRGGAGGARTAGAGRRASRPNVLPEPANRAVGQLGRVAGVPAITSGATTVDSLFGPLPTVETRGTVWLFVNKQLKPVRLRLGTSDGTNTEVLDGNELPAGAEVVTAARCDGGAARPRRAHGGTRSWDRSAADRRPWRTRCAGSDGNSGVL